MVRPDQVCNSADERARGAAAIPLQAALESGAGIFGAVEGKLAVGQPLVGGDLGRPRAFPPRPSRPCPWRDPSRNRSAVLPVRPRTMISADRARCLSSPRSCDGSRRAGNHARLAARGACRHWPRASNSTIDNVCAAAAAPRVRDARGLRLPAWPAPSAVLNGSGGGPANGALISATERNTSGRISAHHAATEQPKSCPTTASTLR